MDCPKCEREITGVSQTELGICSGCEGGDY